VYTGQTNSADLCHCFTLSARVYMCVCINPKKSLQRSSENSQTLLRIAFRGLGVHDKLHGAEYFLRSC